MRFVIAPIAALAVTASALSITSPTKNADVDLTKSTTIEWDSVSSDPSSFSIYLVNMHDYPNVNKLVAENVKTSDGSYTLNGVSGIDKGPGFQVNFVSNNDQNSGILAQSSQFRVKSSSSSSSTTTGKTTKSCKTTTRKPTSTSCTRGTATASSTASSAGDTSSTANPSETTAAPVYSGGAVSLKAPAAAGTLLMGLFFWAL